VEKGLELRIAPTSAWVRSDRRLLRRLLQNLLSNAIKYTRTGGVLLGVRRHSELLSVDVYDTGPGIPKDKRALIFKEFQRLEETASTVRGLGLGLAIVERIGKVLGHPVKLRSVAGRGSTFSVGLPPAEPKERAQAGAPASASAGGLAGLTVLCIDNELAVLRSMQTLLAGWACNVIAAQNATEAVEGLRQAVQEPDIILADYHLDQGTGIEAVAGLRAATGSQAPVIVVTADHSAEIEREVRARGFALLRKPLKAAALRALMHQLTLQRAVAAE
jgi:CheY-like chemotaxis protein